MNQIGRILKGLLVVVTLLITLIAGTAAWVGSKSFEPINPTLAEPKSILFARGKSPSHFMQKLDELNLFLTPTDRELFWWFGKVTRKWGKIKAGEYAITAADTYWTLFDKLESGLSIQYPFTIIEGNNSYEIEKALVEKGWSAPGRFLYLIQDQSFIEATGKSLGIKGPYPPSLEGYLYPDTYSFTRIMSTEEIIKTMWKQFEKNWLPEWNEILKNPSLGLTKHKAVILASMIEKETGATSERGLISAVFHNRLKKGMRLQSDPTIIYGIWNTYSGNLKKADLTTPTPYNTYTVAALPIGPIGNPGKPSLEAALHPSPSDALFFVSHNNGTHEFTKTYGEHLKAVKHFQIDPKAREGKSWRDLSKNPKQN